MEEVLQRLSKAGLRLSKKKVCFSATSVQFLGFIVDANGIKPTPEKVEAIQCAPAPTAKEPSKRFWDYTISTKGFFHKYQLFWKHFIDNWIKHSLDMGKTGLVWFCFTGAKTGNDYAAPNMSLNIYSHLEIYVRLSNKQILKLHQNRNDFF